MLILPPNEAKDQHVAAREGVISHFNDALEKIINENSHRDKYWVLGKAKVHFKHGKRIMRPVLQACDEKHPLVKERLVDEEDNRRGVKTLLWVMHPDETLSFPTLGKSVRVSGGKSGAQILLPG